MLKCAIHARQFISSLRWFLDKILQQKHVDEAVERRDACPRGCTSNALTGGIASSHVASAETPGPTGAAMDHRSAWRRPARASHPLEYRYLTEFQSHEPEFDYLKSAGDRGEDQPGAMGAVARAACRLVLSTNDKTVKLLEGASLYSPYDRVGSPSGSHQPSSLQAERSHVCDCVGRRSVMMNDLPCRVRVVCR